MISATRTLHTHVLFLTDITDTQRYGELWGPSQLNLKSIPPTPFKKKGIFEDATQIPWGNPV